MKRDKTVYDNNNKDKPFSMVVSSERLGEPIATSPEIERQRERVKECESATIKVYDFDDGTYKMIDEVNKRNEYE